MNHQERLELLNALVRAGASFYRSHDLEIQFHREPEKTGLDAWLPNRAATPVEPPAAAQDDKATEKLKELIGTLKMDDASLVDKIFPAGAGG